MAKVTKRKQGTNSKAGILMVGTIVSMAVMLVGAAICAALISAETIPAEAMGYCTLGILLISAFAGAAVAAGKGIEKRLYMSLGIGGAYMVVLFAISALFFGGQYEGIGVTALVVLSGCVLPVLLGMNRRKGVKPHKSKNKRR